MRLSLKIVSSIWKKCAGWSLTSEILRDTAMIHGGRRLQGAQVMSTDLRASAALILTGMVADGRTIVGNLNHLDRGYFQFHKN